MRQNKKGSHARNKILTMERQIDGLEKQAEEMQDKSDASDDEKVDVLIQLGAVYAKYIPLKSLFVIKTEKEDLQRKEDDLRRAVKASIGEGIFLMSNLFDDLSDELLL